MFLRQIEQYRATYTVAPPALLSTLLHNEALLAQADISSLRMLGSGSTPLAPSLLQGTTLARIVDPATGAEITEAGVPGELRIKGPGVFPGYLPASGVPDPFDEDGYLKTGDILAIAGDGLQYLHYVDRSKDMVMRGGMKISAAGAGGERGAGAPAGAAGKRPRERSGEARSESFGIIF